MKANTLIRFLSLAILSIAVVGCASTSSTSSTPNTSSRPTAGSSASTNEADGGVVGTIPPGSKFAKISIGMPMKEVFDLIGEPTDTKAYVTGKTFIPFYFGSDGARTEAIYKGEGRITFTGGTGMGGGAFKVYRIVYDPAESGYNR